MMRSDRSGFALPVTILVIGFLTAGALAAFTRNSAEVVTVDNQRAEVRLFGLAQAGLEQFFVNGEVTDTLRFGFGPDTATVSADSVASVGDTIVYAVRSVASMPVRPGRPAGERTVAQLAYRVPGNMEVRSAWTSLSGLHKNGGSGDISGFDAASPSCSGFDVAGVAVPDGGYSQSGGKPVPEGNPPVEYMGTQNEMKDQVSIDWGAIIEDGALDDAIDYRIGPASFPTSFDDWPMVYVANGANGHYSLPWPGQGILIVEGNLTIDGSNQWSGIVLVGGTLTSNGNNRVFGSVTTGLNIKLGLSVPSNAIGNGTKTFQYDSCAVQQALANFSMLVPISNAWVDNWADW